MTQFSFRITLFTDPKQFLTFEDNVSYFSTVPFANLDWKFLLCRENQSASLQKSPANRSGFLQSPFRGLD